MILQNKTNIKVDIKTKNCCVTSNLFFELLTI